MTNKLSEGVVGKELCLYLTCYADSDSIPTDVQLLKLDMDNNQASYRIDFEDGRVSDWLVTFESSISNKIVSAEMFNQVI